MNKRPYQIVKSRIAGAFIAAGLAGGVILAGAGAAAMGTHGVPEGGSPSLVGHWADGPVACMSGEGIHLDADGKARSKEMRGFWRLTGDELSLFLRPSGTVAREHRRSGYSVDWRVAEVGEHAMTVVASGREERLMRCGK